MDAAPGSERGAGLRRRILIVLLGAIGDVVRALPLLGRLRRAYPQAHIAWAVEPVSQPILEGHGWVDEIIVYDRSRAPWSFVPFLRAVRRANFDLVLDLQRHFKSGLVSLVSGAPERLGFAAANTKELNHLFSTRRIAAQPNLRLKLLQYQAFADLLAIAPAPVEFGLELPAAEQARAEALLAGVDRPIVGVILGSSWPSRIYPAAAVAAVIAALARPAGGSPGLSAALIGGPGEIEFAREVVDRARGAGLLNLAGRTSLRDLIGIFRHCAAAFGPDSGPMHIAAAVGCPVVSLWGATAPERSAPWGFASLAIKSAIPCHPCYLRRCPIGGECMHRIEPAAVAAAVREGIAPSGGSPAPAATP